MQQIDYWTNFEGKILDIVSLALQMLAQESSLPRTEDELNRKLCFCIHQANRQFVASQRSLDHPPAYEARNQPIEPDTNRAAREDKRPDFTWSIYDHNEPSAAHSAKHYTLECKRLGPGTPSWRLNMNYITNGIRRFTVAEWGYGAATSSGLMIGYVRDMPLSAVLAEVNKAARGNLIPPLELANDAWSETGANRLNHQLDRPEVPPTPFDLRHLWTVLQSMEP